MQHLPKVAKKEHFLQIKMMMLLKCPGPQWHPIIHSDLGMSQKMYGKPIRKSLFYPTCISGCV